MIKKHENILFFTINFPVQNYFGHYWKKYKPSSNV